MIGIDFIDLGLGHHEVILSGWGYMLDLQIRI